MEAWREKQAREDQRVALIAWSAFASRGAKKSDGSKFSIDDFVPKPELSDELKEELLAAKFIVLAERTKTVKPSKTNG